MKELPQKITDEIQNLRSVTDERGKPIDEKTLLIIAALHAHNFKTTLSCAGHVKNKRQPWVEIEASDAPTLLKKMQDGAHDGQEFLDNRRALVNANRGETTRLYQLLNEFYSSHTTDYTTILTLDERGPGYARLTPHNAPFIGSELSEEDFAVWLEQAQAEVDAFAGFLVGRL